MNEVAKTTCTSNIKKGVSRSKCQYPVEIDRLTPRIPTNLNPEGGGRARMYYYISWYTCIAPICGACVLTWERSPPLLDQVKLMTNKSSVLPTSDKWGDKRVHVIFPSDARRSKRTFRVSIVYCFRDNERRGSREKNIHKKLLIINYHENNVKK